MENLIFFLKKYFFSKKNEKTAIFFCWNFFGHNIFQKILTRSFECKNQNLKIPNIFGFMLKKANKKNCSKIRGNLMFLPVKNFAHDNFFYKITTKKLRKFAIFHVFCKTVRKIAGKNHIFTALEYKQWSCTG